MQFTELSRAVCELRKTVITMIHAAGRGYTGSALSCIEILALLYLARWNDKTLLRFDATEPGWEERDYFILSKWLAAPALYAVLAQAGFFKSEILADYGREHAFLSDFPSRKIPGVEQTISLLGQGLSLANGVAFSLKSDKKSNRVYVLLESSELQIGQVYEALMTASHYRLDNVIAIVDDNKMQIAGETRLRKGLDPLRDKFESCGWQVVRVHDGHDFDQLLDGLIRAGKIDRAPVALLCDTVSAKGIPFAERKSYYYGAVLSDEELVVAGQALDAQAVRATYLRPRTSRWREAVII